LILLLDVQSIDTDVDRLRHRREHLPEAQRVHDLQVRTRVLSDRITALAVTISDLEMEQRKADNDVEQVRERARKDATLLDSGTISDPKQLQGLQGEIASLERRQSELEDVELEVMERLEAASKDHAALVSESAALSAELAAAEHDRNQVVAQLDESENALTSDREDIVSRIPADLLALYEKLRADHDGIGAARLYRGQCEGCRIELTPVDISRIRESAADEVIRCEECRRILVRTAESGL
jgi:predicted  nucleic acid-binding Zn-ribbon protein